MKKLLTILSMFIFITGCSLTSNMENTPTKRVESFLNNYQTLDSSVLEDLNMALDEDDMFTDKQKETYKDIIKSNYQKMTYNVKDSVEDGDEAVVTVEIEVIDYSTILSDAKIYLDEHQDEFMTNDVYDSKLYNDYRLEQLKKAKDKVKYTIDFTLTKIEDKWVLDDLTKEARDKINGIYEK